MESKEFTKLSAEDVDLIEKALQKEWDSKLDFLIYVSRIITDTTFEAFSLHVAAYDKLNDEIF